MTAINGLALKFQIPNGPVLKTADGQLLRSAGVLTFQDIFDAATGDYITSRSKARTWAPKASTSAGHRLRTCSIRRPARAQPAERAGTATLSDSSGAARTLGRSKGLAVARAARAWYAGHVQFPRDCIGLLILKAP